MEWSEIYRGYMDQGWKWTNRRSVSTVDVISETDNLTDYRAFNPINESEVLTLSLKGNLSCFDISTSTQLWSASSQKIVKATTLVANGHELLTCGVSLNQKGIMEMWRLPDSSGSA